MAYQLYQPVAITKLYTFIPYIYPLVNIQSANLGPMSSSRRIRSRHGGWDCQRPPPKAVSQPRQRPQPMKRARPGHVPFGQEKLLPIQEVIPKFKWLWHINVGGQWQHHFHVHHVCGWFWMWEKTWENMYLRFRFYAHESSTNFGAPLVKTHGFLFPSIPWDPRWAWNPRLRSIGSAPFVPKFCCAKTCHSIQSVPVIWTIQSFFVRSHIYLSHIYLRLLKCGTQKNN